jgi:hypothetical protein
MPTQTDPFDRQRQASSERMSPKQESHATNCGPPPSSANETGTSPDKDGPQGQPQQRRLTLVTPPAGLSYLRGRY